MSVETTNTPNGASKNLYSTNEDVGKQQLTVTDMSEKDPEKDLTGSEPGDNTVAEVSVVIDNTVAIRDNGSVAIRVTLVGQPMIASPEATSTIKVSVEQVKNAMKAKGALTAEDYINLKKERAADKDREEASEEDKDKDNNGIDDRLEQ